MGWLLREAKASVALVGLTEAVATRLTQQFLKTGAEDPGRFVVHPAATYADCRALLDSQKINGICVRLQSFNPQESIAFISDVRQTHPLISFCLVGSNEFLENMPGYHVNWRSRFRHYFRLSDDAINDDFDQNAGNVRDLLIADVVKNTALGQYLTTPGVVIRLKSPIPYGFWISLALMCASAILGGAIGPTIERAFPKSHEAAPPAPAMSSAEPKPKN
jgi:hypothetical protein